MIIRHPVARTAFSMWISLQALPYWNPGSFGTGMDRMDGIL